MCDHGNIFIFLVNLVRLATFTWAISCQFRRLSGFKKLDIFGFWQASAAGRKAIYPGSEDCCKKLANCCRITVDKCFSSVDLPAYLCWSVQNKDVSTMVLPSKRSVAFHYNKAEVRCNPYSLLWNFFIFNHNKCCYFKRKSNTKFKLRGYKVKT